MIGSPYCKNAYKVLLLGGGELGKELVIELQRLGVETHVCDNKDMSPAGQVAHFTYHINMLDATELQTTIDNVKPHCIIPEVEAFNIDVLKEAEKTIKVFPNARATDITMNRQKIRDLAHLECGCQTTNHEYADSEQALFTAVDKIGMPCVIKPLMSSSGKGQSILRNRDEVSKCWKYAQDNSRGNISKVIVEEFIEFDSEITLMTLYDHGKVSFFEPIQHEQKQGDYLLSSQPAQISETALAKAQEYATNVVNKLCEPEDRGIFGMEFFITLSDTVYFNEVSPRPHDTAMVTMCTQLYSQFTVYAHMITNLPIPDTKVYFPGVSHTLLKFENTDNPEFHIEPILETDRDVSVRLFGKTNVTNNRRRMGVVLFRNTSPDQAKSLMNTFAI